MILIGVDPHKSSHTAVAVDAAGHHVAQRRFVVNAGTFRQLMRWCEQWPERRFAIEGARGLGRTLAQQLAATGENVVDVPSTLSARARLLATGGDRKTDANDARHVAQVALFRQDLRPVEPEDQTTILRLLTERHDDLVHERTRVLNRLHAVLRDLLPGGAPTGLSADKAAAAMKGIRPLTATDACRRDIARDLLADLRRLDRQVKDNEAEMRDALAATHTTLTTLPGLGTVLAAKTIGHVGDITRFPTEHHFASYTGSAPLDASSSNNVRHRLNTGGNRALNSVLHVIAVCQIRDGGGRGQEYYLRKIAEGTTPAEARSALKRRLSNVVYRIMKRDQRNRLAQAA
ncbi:IS110 family transposase [Streptomyces sp. FXJ1.172]|uniref:IS110 family transposase n=1 Tax=Streptomyces sp. FXJ1.172 TaxID=710705 RepID=UPI000836AE4F|nr:IS110 family transposase [Streptomyces sp. FXJ1.172]WEO93203.1 IS110 family transposase [Streptomyces sp. FXJ1.172]